MSRKQRYYMRGIGVGILVCALILIISRINTPADISDEEIVSRARALGMVDPGDLSLSAAEDLESNNGSDASGDQTGTDTSADPTLNANGTGTSADQTGNAGGTDNSAEQTESADGSDASGDQEGTDTSADPTENANGTDAFADQTVNANGTDDPSDQAGNADVTDASSDQTGNANAQSGDQTDTSADQTDNANGTDTSADQTGTGNGTDTSAGQNGGGETVPNDNSYAVLVVERGNSSDVVARRLESLGVISDAVDFDKYLVNNGYAGRISVGTFQIQYGSDYDLIARTITRSL